jgi:hypothetical protein
MGSACTTTTNVATTDVNTNLAAANSLELTTTKQEQGSTKKSTKESPIKELPPPKNWAKLNRKKRHEFIKKHPLLAIRSLDHYWLRKIDKYVTKGKLPLLGHGTKGDAAWKLMIETQGKTQNQRVMIWNEFLTLSFSDILKKEEEEERRQESSRERGEEVKVGETRRSVGPKGMAAMRAQRYVVDEAAKM